jgi:tubulin--tyrosine ligase
MKDMTITKAPKFSTIIDYKDPYVQPLILSAIKSCFPDETTTATDPHSEDLPVLHIRQYEELPFEEAMDNSTAHLINAYAIRKALIRKNYLSNTVQNWVAKNPSSILAANIKPSCDFEVDYAEFLDDALVEAWDLHASFQRNADKEPADREWWILKPGMSDRGQGIRIFSTEEELQAIFEGWEADLPDSDDEEVDDEEPSGDGARNEEGDYIMTSQLRHFVAQPYIDPPLLLQLLEASFFPDGQPRKFHIRTYVVAVGALKVYVYRPMLALFAEQPYLPPWTNASSDVEDSDPNDPASLRAHLTNTCLQDGTREGSVQSFWSLPSTSPAGDNDWKSTVFDQICSLTGEIFEAAARSNSIHFQPLPNAFEVFGLDFLVDADHKAWLLEVNAFPDFRQTGHELQGVIAGLWEGVMDVAVAPFFGVESKGQRSAEKEMVLVRDIDLGRR